MGWLPGWNKRLKLTIDQGDIDGALADFPTLVYLSASSGRNSDDVSFIFDELQSDVNRKKIAITTSDGLTQCYVEIERWDDANEKAWLWVKVPNIASDADTDLYFYYDRNRADNDVYVGDTNSTPSENVWGNGYFVTHFKDDPDNAHIRDSSSYSSDGDKAAANQPTEVAGDETAYAQDFNPANPDYVEIAADQTQLNFITGDWSIIARIKLDTLTVNAMIFVRGLLNTDGYFFQVFNGGYLRFYTNQAAAFQRTYGFVGDIVVGTGYTVGVSRTGASAVLYQGGINRTRVSGVHIDPLTSARSAKIGIHDGLASEMLDGKMEFLGVFGGVALTVAFHKAFDESITDDLLAFGEEELSYGVFVNGVEILIEKGSLRVEQRIEERSIANFTIVDLLGTASYSRGQPVIIHDPNDVLIFGGVINNPETIRTAPSGELRHPIACADYHYFADKRLVAESYEAKTCGFIVDDIFDKYLAEEGVTIGNIELGATLVEAVFNYIRVTDAFDALAEKAGKIWFIDENKALYFQSRDITPAPWTITGNDVVKGSGRLSGANPRYRNRQYIRGGKGTTAAQTETFTGDGVTVAFTVGYPIVKVPTVTVNAVGQTVGIKGIDTARQCYWSKGDPTIVFAAAPGAVAVVIVYYGAYDILTLVQNSDEIIAQSAVEGAGTGYVENIADEPTLNEEEALLDSGKAKLARFGIAGKRFHFRTVRTGLKPGQLAPVVYPILALADNMLIESVVTNVHTGNLLYEIVAIQGPESGSWAELFKALTQMKQDVIDRLNVGSEQILIILAELEERVKVSETTTDIIYACPVCGTAQCEVDAIC